MARRSERREGWYDVASLGRVRYIRVILICWKSHQLPTESDGTRKCDGAIFMVELKHYKLHIRYVVYIAYTVRRG